MSGGCRVSGLVRVALGACHESLVIPLLGISRETDQAVGSRLAIPLVRAAAPVRELDLSSTESWAGESAMDDGILA